MPIPDHELEEWAEEQLRSPNRCEFCGRPYPVGESSCIESDCYVLLWSDPATVGEKDYKTAALRAATMRYKIKTELKLTGMRYTRYDLLLGDVE